MQSLFATTIQSMSRDNGANESKDKAYFCLLFDPDLNIPEVKWHAEEAVLGRSNTKSALSTPNFVPIVECLCIFSECFYPVFFDGND